MRNMITYLLNKNLIEPWAMEARMRKVRMEIRGARRNNGMLNCSLTNPR